MIKPSPVASLVSVFRPLVGLVDMHIYTSCRYLATRNDTNHIFLGDQCSKLLLLLFNNNFVIRHRRTIELLTLHAVFKTENFYLTKGVEYPVRYYENYFQRLFYIFNSIL